MERIKKAIKAVSKLFEEVRYVSTAAFDVLLAHPADRSAQRVEMPSFYLVQVSPESLQQRFVTPRSSALISSTGALVVRNPDLPPQRHLRSAEDLLPDGEITAESFELQITDEEADDEPDQEVFGNTVDEQLAQPDPRRNFLEKLRAAALSPEWFPNTTAELHSGTFGSRYEAIRRFTRPEIPTNTRANPQPVRGLSPEELKLIPKNPLTQRSNGRVTHKKSLEELNHRYRRLEVPVLHPSHHAHHHSHSQSPKISENPAKALSYQLPAIWSPQPKSRRLVVRGQTVSFDGAYYTYMHHRLQTRHHRQQSLHRRFLERGWEEWARKFKERTTLTQEISDALADKGIVGVIS